MAGPKHSSSASRSGFGDSQAVSLLDLPASSMQHSTMVLALRPRRRSSSGQRGQKLECDSQPASRDMTAQKSMSFVSSQIMTLPEKDPAPSFASNYIKPVPSPFISLPSEIRRVVYKHYIQNCIIPAFCPFVLNNLERPPPMIFLDSKWWGSNILATSLLFVNKLIHTEFVETFYRSLTICMSVAYYNRLSFIDHLAFIERLDASPSLAGFVTTISVSIDQYLCVLLRKVQHPCAIDLDQLQRQQDLTPPDPLQTICGLTLQLARFPALSKLTIEVFLPDAFCEQYRSEGIMQLQWLLPLWDVFEPRQGVNLCIWWDVYRHGYFREWFGGRPDPAKAWADCLRRNDRIRGLQEDGKVFPVG